MDMSISEGGESGKLILPGQTFDQWLMGGSHDLGLIYPSSLLTSFSFNAMYTIYIYIYILHTTGYQLCSDGVYNLLV